MEPLKQTHIMAPRLSLTETEKLTCKSEHSQQHVYACLKQLAVALSARSPEAPNIPFRASQRCSAKAKHGAGPTGVHLGRARENTNTHTHTHT